MPCVAEMAPKRAAMAQLVGKGHAPFSMNHPREECLYLAAQSQKVSRSDAAVRADGRAKKRGLKATHSAAGKFAELISVVVSGVWAVLGGKEERETGAEWPEG